MSKLGPTVVRTSNEDSISRVANQCCELINAMQIVKLERIAGVALGHVHYAGTTGSNKLVGFDWDYRVEPGVKQVRKRAKEAVRAE